MKFIDSWAQVFAFSFDSYAPRTLLSFIISQMKAITRAAWSIAVKSPKPMKAGGRGGIVQFTSNHLNDDCDGPITI